MITPFFLAATNHLLTQSDWAQQRFALHDGQTARLDLSPFIINFTISSEGLLAKWIPETGEEPDVVLLLAIEDTPQILHKGMDEIMRRVHIKGNAEFAETLGFVFRHLDWDIEEDISRITGDIIAHRLANTARSIFAFPRQALDSIGGNLTEYLTEEKPVLTTKTQSNDFSQEISQLRDAIARAEKRIDRLYSHTTVIR